MSSDKSLYNFRFYTKECKKIFFLSETAFPLIIILFRNETMDQYYEQDN